MRSKICGSMILAIWLYALSVCVLGGGNGYQEPPPNRCKGVVVHGVEFLLCTRYDRVCISKKELAQVKSGELACKRRRSK